MQSIEALLPELPPPYTFKHFEVDNGEYITFEQYLEMDFESGYLEWEDGRVFGFMPNNRQHQVILKFLITLMQIFLEKYELGEIMPAGYAMKLGRQKSGRQPDLVFIRNENLGRMRPGYLDGPADLAVEIVSPESGRRDRDTKFKEYAAAGIQEYWLIDPVPQTIEFFRLGPDGHYTRISSEGGTYRSEVLTGFFLRPEWLWPEKLSTRVAREELGLVG